MGYGKRRGAFSGRFLCEKPWFFGFGVHCGLRIFHFVAFGFWFSWKILTGFRFWYPIWFLVFPIWPTLFGFLFLLDLSSNYTPPLILLDANVIERNAWQTNWNIAGIPRGFTRLEWHPRLWSSIGFHAPWMTPRLWPCWALMSRLINMWTMSSNMPNTLVMEEGQLWIVLCLWRWERWQEFQREKQV